jgi:SynChlorMet cassette radical SAM/SPASM protein ScmF
MPLCDPLPESKIEPCQPDGVPPLTTLYLYLTEGCNLRCRHCWIAPTFAGRQLAPGEYLDVDLLDKAVAEGKPLGLSQAKLTGGEPLLHPHFLQVVDRLTAAGLSLMLETNGTLLDHDLARYLKENTRLGFVSVSLDGPTPAVHDAFRGVEGSFEAAVRGFRHLVEAEYRPQLIMSLYQGNVQSIEQVVALAVSLGAGSVKFNPVTRSGRGIALYEHGEALDLDQVMELAHFVRGPLQRRTPIPLYLETPPALYTVGELLAREQAACQIRYILGILGSGEMALCGIGWTVPGLCFGNLRDTSLADVWRSHPLLQQLRQELDGTYPAVCGECIHAHQCLTHCVAQNYLDSGQLVWPDALCAEAYARGQFPAERLRAGAARGSRPVALAVQQTLSRQAGNPAEGR